jgi:hypothetical protein
MPAKLRLSSHRPSGRCIASNRPVGIFRPFGTAKLLRPTRAFGRPSAVGSRGLIGVRLQPHVRAAIEQIPEQAWQTLAD